MPSLVFTTFVSRSLEPTGSNDIASAPPAVAALVKTNVDPAPSRSPIFLGLRIAGALVLLFLVAYFAYRIIKRRQCKDGRPLSSLRPFILRGDAVQRQPRDIEKGAKSAYDVINKISGPMLLFGTGPFVPNNPVNSGLKYVGEMDITEALFEHGETSYFNGKDIPGEAQLTMESSKVVSPRRAGDGVSPRLVKEIQTSTATSTSSEKEVTLKSSGHGGLGHARLAKRDIVVINDERGLEGAGLTKDDIIALRNTRELYDDKVPVRAAALVTLADKFKTFESLGEEACFAQLESSVYDEPHSIGSLSSSYSTFDLHDLDTASMEFPSSEDLFWSPSVRSHCNLLRPSWTVFKSKEDAQATLLARRIEMQRSPELCFLIPNPVARVPGSYNSATIRARHCPEPIQLENIGKEKRYTAVSHAAKVYRPKLSSPLASGLVICGQSCSSSKGLKVALRGLLPSSAKMKTAPTTKMVRRSPGLAVSSTVIPDKRSSSELLVELLKHRQRSIPSEELNSALPLSKTNTAQSAAQCQATASAQAKLPPPSTQHPPTRSSTGRTATMSTAMAPHTSRVQRTIDTVSSSRPAVSSTRREHLVTTRTSLESRPRTPTIRSSPETRSASNSCARIPTLVEELEKDNLSLRSPPSTRTNKSNARRSFVATPPARYRTTTEISGINERTVKEKDQNSLRSPSRAHQLPTMALQNSPGTAAIRASTSNELPDGFPLPPVTLGPRIRLGPATVGRRTRQASGPTAVERSNLSEDKSSTKVASSSLSGVSLGKRQSLSDISNSPVEAYTNDAAPLSSMGSSALNRRSPSVITSRAFPAGHACKPSSSTKASENLWPPQRTPVRARRHPSGASSSTSAMTRGGVPTTKGAFRA